MENLAEYYYTLLSETNKPGVVLNKMWNDLFGTETLVSRIKTFNKLVRLYGRFEVYFALLDIATWNEITNRLDVTRSPFPLISKFIVSRLEKKYATRSDSYGVDLDPLVRKINKLIKDLEKEKLEIPETFHNGD